MFTSPIPPLHISRIGPFLQILAIRENTGRPGRGSGMTREEGGRNGKKWVGTGRSDENNHPPPPPHHTGQYWKNTGRSGRSGSNMGDKGTTRELYGSNTAQNRITRANTGDFSPSWTSTWCRFSGCPRWYVGGSCWTSQASFSCSWTRTLDLPASAGEASCPSVQRGVSCQHDSMASGGRTEIRRSPSGRRTWPRGDLPWDNIFTSLKFHSRVVILYNMRTPGWIQYIICAPPGEHLDIVCSPWPWYFCPRGW